MRWKLSSNVVLMHSFMLLLLFLSFSLSSLFIFIIVTWDCNVVRCGERSSKRAIADVNVWPEEIRKTENRGKCIFRKLSNKSSLCPSILLLHLSSLRKTWVKNGRYTCTERATSSHTNRRSVTHLQGARTIILETDYSIL